MNTAAILRALQTSQLADNGLLTTNEKIQVQQTLAALAQRGWQAYVVVLPQSEELTTWHKLWPLMQLPESNALLLLYNGRRWEARGWALATLHSAILRRQQERQTC